MTNDFLKRASLFYLKKESEIKYEREFVKYCESKGCKALKLVMLNRSGFPDRTIICPKGLIFFVEFKSDKGDLTKLQIKYKKLLESLGFEYYVCRSYESAKTILQSKLGS